MRGKILFCRNNFNNLFDEAGKVAPPLQELLRLTGISSVTSELKEVVRATQHIQPIGWLRPPGQERWQVKDIFKDIKEAVTPIFAQLAYTSRVMPTKKSYDYCLFLGDDFSGVELRLNFLLFLLKKNIECKQIIVLTGERALDINYEEPQLLKLFGKTLTKKDFPKTEYQMINFLFDFYYHQSFPVKYISAPIKIMENGVTHRPNTADTIYAWLKTNPRKGSCIAISCQPYIGYQDAVLKTILYPHFSIESVGDKYHEESVVLLLDTLARQLYQIQVCIDKNFNQ